MRKAWRVIRWILLALGVVLLIPLIPLVGALVECRVWQRVETPETHDSRWAAALASLDAVDLDEYARREDQTYLTLPEWYIVFNADEYAAHLAESPPSRFPHFRAIGQYWRTYYGACRQLRGRYPFNTEYQVIVGVISVSFTVESGARGLYENTIGRVFEWTSSGEPTAEELYAQRIATEYGTFIHTIPWFRFPFGEALRGLWRETSPWGPDPLRKWERKLILSAEYGIKAGYGWLLGMGRDASFAPVTLETQFVAAGVSDELLESEEKLRVIERIDDEFVVAGLPRYEEFTQIVPQLVAEGVRFAEIAGNDDIAITAFVPPDWENNLESGTVLYRMPVLIPPARHRIAVSLPVIALHTVLTELTREGGQLEHIYDY